MAPGRSKKQHKKKKPIASSTVSYMERWSGSLGIPLVELHSHSTCSDGLLSPEQLVERAFRRGVRVLALTDHDTMAGVPGAIMAARQYGIRVIPGVEISARYQNSCGRMGESVHILAYYGWCGPAGGLEEKLMQIREGRYTRARAMVQKLEELKKPLKWEDVLRVAGPGVAPGRPHLARALVQAGHVGSVREAFNRYLFDDGPAYATGCELSAEQAVQLIIQTGGVAVLAHPWTLKNPLVVIKQLRNAGLHAIEVYKADGKDQGFAALADAYQLVKLGGADFHGTGAADETDLGKVEIPFKALDEFLKLAEPIWSTAAKEIVSNFAEGTLRRPFGKDSSKQDAGTTAEPEFLCGDVEILSDEQGLMNSLRLSSWLRGEEMEMLVKEAECVGLEHAIDEKEESRNMVVTRHVS